jgi:hypothetical protein
MTDNNGNTIEVEVTDHPTSPKTCVRIIEHGCMAGPAVYLTYSGVCNLITLLDQTRSNLLQMVPVEEALARTLARTPQEPVQ